MTDAARRRLPSPTLLALGALAAGLALGVAAQSVGGVLRAFVELVEPLGTLWVNAIRMTLVPLVVSLLIGSVAGFADVRALGRIGARTMFLFIVLLSGVALFSALAAPPLLARTPLDAATADALRAKFAAPAADAVAELPTLRGFVTGLVPVNPLRAAVDGAMLPLIVFTVLFAVAVTRLPQERRVSVLVFFGAIGEAMLTVVRWVLAVTPIGVFALAAAMGAELGLGVVGPVAWYVAVLCGLDVATTLLLYPVAALWGRVSIATFARIAAPGQAMAIATRSSLASLPALIEGARRGLGERPALAGFVLPLCVATFKVTTPVADLVGPLFLAQLYGVDLSVTQVATMAIVSIAMSFSNPGIPSGGLFVVAAPVLLSAGLPLDGIALLVAADAVPDIFNTVGNVTGNMTVATIVARDLPLGAAEPA